MTVEKNENRGKAVGWDADVPASGGRLSDASGDALPAFLFNHRQLGI
jgi:hypothetical protein